MKKCPALDRLFSYTQSIATEAPVGGGELSATEAEAIRLHLGDCESCHQQSHQLQKVVSATTTSSLTRPPDWLLRQALTLFQQQKSAPRESLLKRILALLVVDSFAEGRLLGLRSTEPMSRQLLYRAEGYDVDLLIEYDQASQSVEIIGQSMPLSKDLTTVAGADVELLKGPDVALATKTNEFGEFILDGLQEGIYDLRIRLKDEQIEIANVQATVRPGGQETTQ